MRMGFGRKQDDDEYATELDFEEDDNFMIQMPSPQVTYTYPNSPFDKKKVALSTKTIPRAIKDYLARCYNDPDSPIHHVFSQDIKTTFPDKENFDKAIIAIIQKN